MGPVRALREELGVEANVDLDAQRAIVLLPRPTIVDILKVESAITRTGFLFGGIHIRVRARILDPAATVLSLEFEGSGQRMIVSNPDAFVPIPSGSFEAVGWIEGWKSRRPKLYVLSVRK